MSTSRHDPARFPLGAAVRLADLDENPYPIFERLRRDEPVSWLPALGMWYVTRYEDVRAILMDANNYTTASPDSLIYDTFGEQILSSEGARHDRYRKAVQPAFMPGHVRKHYEEAIRTATRNLVEGFRAQGEVELRAAFASRLPIHAILTVFGMPLDAEPAMRRWYDSFEQALQNFTRDARVRVTAKTNIAEMHAFVSDAMRRARGQGTGTLLGALVNAPADERLSDEEIVLNVTIIFFGGISTVEALILNAVWALLTHPEALRLVREKRELVANAVEETMRWLSPVQSATRHVVHPAACRGISFEPGETVNCMLGSANRDPQVFADPDRFDIERGNVQRHLGFATGMHACIGFHLAKTEGRMALNALLDELPGLRLEAERSLPPRGYEFRQSRALYVAWERGR